MEINSQYGYYELLWLSQYPTKNNEHVWFCAVLYKKNEKKTNGTAWWTQHSYECCVWHEPLRSDLVKLEAK